VKTPRRLPILLVILGTLIAVVPPAYAADFDPNGITFPVDGQNHYTDTFDACRGSDCSRLHQAIDIMAAKGVPVLAAAAGTVEWIGSTCCLLRISHGGGWDTQYIHLNNDTQQTDGTFSDDGNGWGIAPGIEVGTYVEAGQLIGWVGDSGNAEHVGSHLHFEIWQDETRINPYPYLMAAEETDTQTSYTGIFRDDDYSVHEQDIDALYHAGITKGCSLEFDYCPEREITRGEMAAFIARALNLESTTDAAHFSDQAGHYFEEEIDKVVTAGIGFGCTETEYCPDRALRRDEMAEMLVRAFGYTNPEGGDFFVDDEDNPFEPSINSLASVEVTLGCSASEYCPERLLTRAEMASFFVRALGY
jgi:hypothetical protein